jgi:hypothetical protein
MLAVHSVTSKASRQYQDDQNEQNEPQATTRPVAPVAAVRPCRECSNEQENQNDQQDGTHDRPPFLLNVDGFRRRTKIIEIVLPIVIIFRLQAFEILVRIAQAEFEFSGEICRDQVGCDNVHDEFLSAVFEKDDFVV